MCKSILTICIIFLAGPNSWNFPDATSCRTSFDRRSINSWCCSVIVISFGSWQHESNWIRKSETMLFYLVSRCKWNELLTVACSQQTCGSPFSQSFLFWQKILLVAGMTSMQNTSMKQSEINPKSILNTSNAKRRHSCTYSASIQWPFCSKICF